LKVTENSENAKYLTSDVSYELANFEEFMEKRQEPMNKVLKDILYIENSQNLQELLWEVKYER
jgi:hypothetical protein